MKTLSDFSDAELLDTTRLHVKREQAMDAELLLLLGEIDERRLFADGPSSSMFAFCTQELGFSEGVAYNRIVVSRLARRLPRVLDFVREGRIHLTGLRLLAEHLTEANLEAVLAEASGKSKRAIEELVARLAPKPPVPTSIRMLPERQCAPTIVEEPPSLPLLDVADAPSVDAVPPRPPPQRAEVKALSAKTYSVTFTVDSALQAKLEQAEELMRHRVGPGNTVAVIEAALDLLIAEVKKERFGVGRKPRGTPAYAEQREVVTRHIPDAIKREVYERDGGQCAFVAPDGRRCEERGGLEFEHTEGFARTRRHAVEELKLLCRAHNQRAADKLYGREFMEAKRRGTFPGNGEMGQVALL